MLNNPFPKKQEAIVEVFEYPIECTIKLPKPKSLNQINFWDVVESRKSVRLFRKLSIEDIGKILWVSAKVKNLRVQSNGYILTKRPSASAGARHPIDICILSPILDDSKKFYYYNPFEHSLNKLTFKNDKIKDLKSHLMSILEIDQVTIFCFVAHQKRTEAKYGNPISLIWRDAGALTQSIQLTCTALSINSCPVGSLGEPFISEIFGQSGNVYSAGIMIIG